MYLLHWKKDEKSKELYGFEKVDTSKSEFVKLVKNLLINFWSTTPIPSILGTIFYQCELMVEIFPPHFEAYTTVLNREKGIWNEPTWTNIVSYSLMHMKWKFTKIEIIQLGLF